MLRSACTQFTCLSRNLGPEDRVADNSPRTVHTKQRSMIFHKNVCWLISRTGRAGPMWWCSKTPNISSVLNAVKAIYCERHLVYILRPGPKCVKLMFRSHHIQSTSLTIGWRLTRWVWVNSWTTDSGSKSLTDHRSLWSPSLASLDLPRDTKKL